VDRPQASFEVMDRLQASFEVVDHLQASFEVVDRLQASLEGVVMAVWNLGTWFMTIFLFEKASRQRNQNKRKQEKQVSHMICSDLA
jgi:hypothetical protein